jgi:hypothetical protein
MFVIFPGAGQGEHVNRARMAMGPHFEARWKSPRHHVDTDVDIRLQQTELRSGKEVIRNPRHLAHSDMLRHRSKGID